MSLAHRHGVRHLALWVAGCLLAGCLLASLTAGCGSPEDDDPDARAIAATVGELHAAFERGDWPRICKRLSDAARRQAGILAHGSPEACVGDLREAFRVIHAGRGLQRGEAIEVGDVGLDGDEAEVALAVDGWSATVPFKREGGRWKLDSFFGVTAHELDRVALSAHSAPFPEPEGEPAQAISAGQPCLDTIAADYPNIIGDCEIEGRTESIAVEVMTPFGHFRFGNCTLTYHAWVDGRGRAWTDSFSLNSQLNNGCADTLKCENREGEDVPWKGTLGALPDGRIVHTMRACFTSCIGYYVGELSITFTPEPDGWRAEAIQANVGSSGMHFEGPLSLRTPFDARPIPG